MKCRVCFLPIPLGTTTSPNLCPSPQKFLYTSSTYAYQPHPVTLFISEQIQKIHGAIGKKEVGRRHEKGRCKAYSFFFNSHPLPLYSFELHFWKDCSIVITVLCKVVLNTFLVLILLSILTASCQYRGLKKYSFGCTLR